MRYCFYMPVTRKKIPSLHAYVETPAGQGTVIGYVVPGLLESKVPDPGDADPLCVVRVGKGTKDYRSSRLRAVRASSSSTSVARSSRKPVEPLSAAQSEQVARVYGVDAARALQEQRARAVREDHVRTMLLCNICGGRLNKRTGNCRDCEG